MSNQKPIQFPRSRCFKYFVLIPISLCFSILLISKATAAIPGNMSDNDYKRRSKKLHDMREDGRRELLNPSSKPVQKMAPPPLPIDSRSEQNSFVQKPMETQKILRVDRYQTAAGFFFLLIIYLLHKRNKKKAEENNEY